MLTANKAEAYRSSGTLHVRLRRPSHASIWHAVRLRWWFPGLVPTAPPDVSSGVWVLPSQERANHIDADLGAENASPTGVGSEIVDKVRQCDVGEAWVAQA